MRNTIVNYGNRNLSGNLIMIFIATESASIPSYALAGFRKKNKMATEGSLKYVLFGSVSSALMLYGMSMLYGVSGSLQLSDIASTINTDGMTPLMVVGLVGMLGGFAFKLSAVPMHFWCPDVFEGAPTEVTTFLSVASKGAAICMLAVLLPFWTSLLVRTYAWLVLLQKKGILSL